MLEKIQSSADLKKYTPAELVPLAQEIRALIIETVSRTGGHLASSLGAVELCIALHYCLDTPRDTVIFDVGHQAYAHKILTGRRKQFSGLRQKGGISGFPNPAESAYDTFISGHASTAVSWAQGVVEAKRIRHDTSKTVALIGDGSLTGGMVFEALNNCGHKKNNIIVLLNHNEMSISRSEGALGKYLTEIISMPVYNRIVKELHLFLRHLPSFAKKLAHAARRFEEAIKGLVVPGIFFEELGFRYFGPLDGHNLEVLIPTLTNIFSLEGPRIVHVITKKGKGYEFAEDNAEQFHSSSPFEVSKGAFIKKGDRAFTEVFAQKLVSMAREDKQIVAITAAMAKGTGLTLFQKQFPARYYDVGIAEAHAVGLAAGLARGGLRPYVAIYSTFLQRAFDQIIHDVALQNLPVVFCLDRAGFVGQDGPTHHGVFDIAYLRTVPGLICMAPKDAGELEDMLAFSRTLKNPASIRYPKGEAYSLESREKITLGKSQRLSEGTDVSIIALGSMVSEALETERILRKDGIKASVINARFIKPLDEEMLVAAAEECGIVVTVEEGVLGGGFGSAVIEFYERFCPKRPPFMRRFGIPDEFSPCASRKDLFKQYGIDAVSLAESIKSLYSRRI